MPDGECCDCGCLTCTVCPPPYPSCLPKDLHLTTTGFPPAYGHLNGSFPVRKRNQPATELKEWLYGPAVSNDGVWTTTVRVICPEPGVPVLSPPGLGNYVFNGVAPGDRSPFLAVIDTAKGLFSARFFAGWVHNGDVGTYIGGWNFTRLPGHTTVSCVPPDGRFPSFYWTFFDQFLGTQTTQPALFPGPSAVLTA